jgi:hypothetical protein
LMNMTTLARIIYLVSQPGSEPLLASIDRRTIDLIKDWRSKSIQETLSSYHHVTKSLMEGTLKHGCSEKKRCAFMLLGSLWTGIIKVRGSLLPHTEDEISESVTDLVTCVRKALTHVQGLEFDLQSKKYNDSYWVHAAVRLRHTALSSTGVLKQARLKQQRCKLGLPGKLNKCRTVVVSL